MNSHPGTRPRPLQLLTLAPPHTTQAQQTPFPPLTEEETEAQTATQCLCIGSDRVNSNPGLSHSQVKLASLL